VTARQYPRRVDHIGQDSAETLRTFGGEPNDIALRASRPQSLIITIFGSYSRTMGGWLSVSTLLTLMGQVGVEDAAVRSALSRFKRRGILLAERRGNAAGYALSENAWRTFDVGDARVLQRREPPASSGWVLAAFSIPERSRDVRYRLRSRLARVGFAQVAGGLWIAPRALEPDVRYIVDVLGVHEHVNIFQAEHVGFGSTVEAVREWWNLDDIGAQYTAFTRSYRSIGSSHLERTELDPASAFADYTKVLTSWRPLPYIDPGLPREFLPRTWAGDEATDLFYSLHDSLYPLAQEHVENVAQ
jgi:phenylacetic acid degradation operon negative regulatory protein